MGGIEIQYALGLYFAISAITFKEGKFVADGFKLIAGIILILTAIFGFTLIR